MLRRTQLQGAWLIWYVTQSKEHDWYDMLHNPKGSMIDMICYTIPVWQSALVTPADIDHMNLFLETDPVNYSFTSVS